jgi:ribosomal-protein-alanine N-acetyltransferase
MLTSSRLTLRPLVIEDAQNSLDLELRNREFFSKFSVTRFESFYTLERQVEGIKRAKQAWDSEAMLRFGVFLNGTGELIGTVALNDIIRGGIQSCYIGYTLDHIHNGKGYTSEAVAMVVKYGFDVLKLHRIEAGVMPTNIASQKVLEKCGFVREGLARKNVNINGRWEDHYSYGIINPIDELIDSLNEERTVEPE